MPYKNAFSSKTKVLQKLKWYCRVCLKQYRNGRGFCFHIKSNSHIRCDRAVSTNKNECLDGSSSDFVIGFLKFLKRKYNCRRVNATKVYEGYISAEDHINITLTKWTSLTDFLKWLGWAGKCLVEKTERGWFVTYIDQDMNPVEAGQAWSMNVGKIDEGSTETQGENVNEETAPLTEALENENVQAQATDNEDKQEDSCITENEEINNATVKIEKPDNEETQNADAEKVDESQEPNSTNDKDLQTDDLKSLILQRMSKRGNPSLSTNETPKLRKSALKTKTDYWLTEGIIVSITKKNLGKEFYKQTAIIKQVVNRNIAALKLLNTGKKISLPQEYLETVIPDVGRLVKLIGGVFKGETALIRSINEIKRCSEVEITSGILKGRIIPDVSYKDICQMCE